MVDLREILKNVDLAAIALPNDKLDECKYFFQLLSGETNRSKFRWLLSAFLNSCYSYLEVKAQYLYNACNDPETGEPFEDEESLSVLRHYVRAFQLRKNSGFVKTSGLTELTKKLYELRNSCTHDGGLAVMVAGESLPNDFHIGHLRGQGTPALGFCEKILSLFEIIENELTEV
jgi:hypothetical protein